MKKILKYLLFLIILIPFNAYAIKKNTVSLNEVKDGYYCYLLSATTDGRFYDAYYSYKEFGAISKNKDASKKPNPRCFDDTINNKVDFLAGNNCFFDLYSTKTAVEKNEKVKYSYDGWNSSITDTNRYYSNMKDCIASLILTDGVDSANTHSENTTYLFMEAKKNSEVYTDDEMKKMKELYSDFNDDTKFCYGTSMYAYDITAPMKIFFGHPQIVVDLRGVIDLKNFEDDDENLLAKNKDSNNKRIINFDGIDVTWDAPTRGNTVDGKISVDVIPRIEDKISTVKNFEKDGYNESKTYILVDDNGKLITDSKTCIELAEQAGANDKTIDTTNEDKDRKITDKDFSQKLYGGMSKSQAIKSCYTGDSKDGEYHCYRYTFIPSTSPMYNTTVWTKKQLSCGFELVNWDWTQCKKSALDVTYNQCKTITTKDKDGKDVDKKYCQNITHSGYNGTPDFYDERGSKDKDIECDNLNAFHIIYRAATIIAPIITILFVTFDLVSSIISGDPKKVAKFRSKLLRRIIALILLLVAPVLIHILVNTLSKNESLKNTKYLQCIVLGKKPNGGETTVKNANPGDENKNTSNLFKNVTVDGKSINYNTSTKKYNVTVPNGTNVVNVDAEVIKNEVKIISGLGANDLVIGPNTINVVASLGDVEYDTVTLYIEVNEDTGGGSNPKPTTPTTPPKSAAAGKTALLNSAKKLKTLTSKKGSKTFWCAKRCKKGKKTCTKAKDQANPPCETKVVEKLYGNKQKFGKNVGGYSCASLVSYSLYDSGLYTAYEVNHVAGSTATRNINSANSAAKFLIAKGWKVITKAKDLKAGDVIFEDRSGKPAVKVGGKTHHPGHVEIYAGDGKSYNTGGTSVQHVLKSKYNKKGFGFAMRYVGK